MSRARTWRSITAGPRIKSVGCGAAGRFGSPTGRRDRHGRRCCCNVRGQGGNHDHSHRVHRRRRLGQAWPVASLARPGGNLTGINFFNTEVSAKRLELLRELVPAAARVAVLLNPTGPPDTETTFRDMEPAARAMGLQIQVLSASTGREINAAFSTFVRNQPDALFVAPDPFFLSRRIQLAIQAARHAVPATFASREYVEAGGLMSYGTNFVDTYRQMGVYTGRILQGAKPADLPVMQSSKFELVARFNQFERI